MSEEIVIYRGDDPTTLRFNPEDRSLDLLIIDGTEEILRHSELPEKVEVFVVKVGPTFSIRQKPGVSFRVGEKTKESNNLLGVPCLIDVETKKPSPPELIELIRFASELPWEVKIDPQLAVVLAQAGLGLLS